ncbi:unnamed protein product [Vitrella brassicaformis CCMP3155]|uniref:TNFR-Cys domain-containing protein n=6 Tax=Vitrella brassicaformis TaxID=1169539 RepID=A0A0G4H3B6_VITBC|nr:unnamed protein product [Vitrella brassicaformis CCMP3155]|eukprot:CEM37955.1 unnamed protein product [Vitrella brassicaformis CCMP3155]
MGRPWASLAALLLIIGVQRCLAASPYFISFTAQPAGPAPPSDARVFEALAQITVFVQASGPVAPLGGVAVTLTLNDATAAVLKGDTVAITSAAGVATFSNVFVTSTGTYRMLAYAYGMEGGSEAVSVESDPFTISDATPNTFGISTDVTGSYTAGDSITFALSGADQGGDVHVTVDSPVELIGTTKQSPADPVTFNDLVITTAGTGYQLIAYASGYRPITSNTFNVIPKAANALQFSVSPSSAYSRASFDSQPTVIAVDQFGNTDEGFVDDVTLTVATDSCATLYGTTVETAALGEASFVGLSIDKAGTYRLRATEPGGLTGLSEAFSIWRGLGEGVEWVIEPPNPMYVGESATVKVRLVDVGGNPLYDSKSASGEGYTVQMSLDGGGGPPTLTGTTDMYGEATFTVAMIATGTGDQWRAVCTTTVCGGASALSASFDTEYKNASIIASQPSTIMEGHSTTYWVRLGTQPSDTVVIDITSNATTPPQEVTVSPTQLTFSTESWFRRQYVTVTGVDGSVSGGTSLRAALSHDPSTSADLAYKNPGPHRAYRGALTDVSNSGELYIDVLSDDTYAVIIEPPAMSIIEGTSGTYTIYATAPPPADVIISLTVSGVDPTRITANPAPVTISAGSTAGVNVTVNALAYTDPHGERVQYDITHAVTSPLTGAPPIFPPDGKFHVSVLDDKTAGIVVSENALIAQEDTTSAAQFTVELEGAASGTVTVNVNCPAPEVTPSATSVQWLTGDTSAKTVTLDVGPYATRWPMTVDVFCDLTAVAPSDSRFNGLNANFVPGSRVHVKVVKTLCDTANGEYGPDCADCPAGESCGNTTTPCADGEYNDALNIKTFCLPCPAGSQCFDKTAAPAACNPGFYSLGRATACTECPAGFFCPRVDAQPIPCPLGTMSAAQATLCVPCVAREACPDPKLPKVTCSAPDYSLPGDLACRPCPPGHECGDPAQPPDPCLPGRYSTGGQTSCDTCAAGTMCPEFDQAVTVACSTGTYSAANSAHCLPCPAGSSCTALSATLCTAPNYSLGGASACTPCPDGHFCPSANYQPQQCRAGTYSNTPVTGCANCNAGYLCQGGSTDPDTDLVPLGFSYLAGTPRYAVPCPPGESGGGGANTACGACLAGYWCPAATRAINGDLLCRRGHVCPTGTGSLDGGDSSIPAGTACPAGTYNPTPGQSNWATDCLACPAGRWCRGASRDAMTPCPIGYYCRAGTTPADNSPVAPTGGKYSGKRGGLSDPSHFLDCPAGHYCDPADPKWNSGEVGLLAPIPCDPGTYNPDSGQGPSSSCVQCDAGKACPFFGMASASVNCSAGYYCPLAGSIPGTRWPQEFPCPRGTYLDAIDGEDPADCVDCPAGKVCALGTGGPAFPPQPCPIGHYCPLRTEYPTQNPCDPGTYSPYTGLTHDGQCLGCPPGFFCSGGKAAPDGPCAKGHFCPANTTDPLANPCPSGRYTTRTDLIQEADCDYCPEGMYCLAGTVYPIPCPEATSNMASFSINRGVTGVWDLTTRHPAPPSYVPNTDNQCAVCPPGYYCLEGVPLPQPCGKGYYSREGQTGCTACVLGHYCDSDTTPAENVTGPSSAWTECPGGTLCDVTGVDHRPTLNTRPCPRGYYCPQGDTAAQPCLAGTYNPYPGQDSNAACLQAPAGKYVSAAGSFEPDGLCAPNKYCDGGSDVADEHNCLAGTYRDYYGGKDQTDCGQCLSGFYCPDGAGRTDCTAGNYCPPGSPTVTPCPAGKFGNVTNLRDEDMCTPCTPGKYCQSTGLREPEGDCDAGHTCLGGASQPDPSDNVTGTICTPGGYCTAGSSLKDFCDPGTYNPDPGGESQANCTNCPGGFYCGGSNEAQPSGECLPGYYCTGSASKPTQIEASPGHFTRSGFDAELDCPTGTYNALSARDECAPCKPRKMCDTVGMTDGVDCSDNAACPLGSDAEIPCPPGTYANTSVAPYAHEEECLKCPPGQFCAGTGMTEATIVDADCTAGHFCTGGSATATPPFLTAAGGPCPMGFTCEVGSTAPTPCERGQYLDLTQQTSPLACKPCPGGSYCYGIGLALPAGLCPEGWYCPTGSPYGQVQPKEFRCGTGKRCPLGSAAEEDCPAGTYNPDEEAASCLVCPSGFFCVAGLDTYATSQCDAGHYCPEGTQLSNQYACPIGTYNSQNQTKSIVGCVPCDPGNFCDSAGSDSVQGPCQQGHYCVGGATGSAPTDVVTEGGAECVASTYCPTGSTGPYICDYGQYCATNGLDAPDGPCLAGYYCDGGAIFNNENDCPPGAYCPEGSGREVLCPPGSFSNDTRNEELSDCDNCPAGEYCADRGLTEPTGNCTAGFFCLENSTWHQPSGGECPEGHACPEASPAAVPCTNGEYQPFKGQSTCIDCPQGFTCNGTDAFECQGGYYCPVRTPNATGAECPIGTYNNFTARWEVSQCVDCPPGKYCDATALAYPVDDCTEGYYCEGGTTSSTPTSAAENGFQCTNAYTCPEGSTQPTPCPNGVFCNGSGTPLGTCSAGYVCKQLAEQNNPGGTIDVNQCPSDNTTGPPVRAYGECPVGHYCEEGTSDPVRCPAGRYRDTEQATGVLDCTECDEAQYCWGTAQTAITGDCEAGFFCPAGSKSSTQFLCYAGHSCAGNNAFPDPCSPQEYQDWVGQLSCKTCPPGFVCATDGLTAPVACPQGQYCEGSTDTPLDCPVGTYGALEHLTNSSECAECSPGKYCSAPRLTSPGPDCDAGYYCRWGSDTATPAPTYCPPPTAAGAANVSCIPGRECPSGMYCPAGSAAPLPCPPGTTGSPEGSSVPGDCGDCPAGFFCSSTGTPIPCDMGFVCYNRSETPTPTVNIPSPPVQGIICPFGYYCPAGTLTELLCVAPTYSDAEGLGECLGCPAGFYCNVDAMSNGTEFVCPKGNYCPFNVTTPIPCPPGTFADAEALTSPDDCSICPRGYYCDTDGQSSPAGPCDAGFICMEGSQDPQPFHANYTQPTTPFPPVTTTAAPTVGPPVYTGPEFIVVWPPPPEGWPVGGGLCPVGFYCPQGTDNPIPCPFGTFGNETAQSDETVACTSCPPGRYCGDANLTNPTGTGPCDPGYFCVGGAKSSHPTDRTAPPLFTGNICPEGSFCPDGTDTAFPCPNNTFADVKGLEQCNDCPPRTYCQPEGHSRYQPCPDRLYCPGGGADPQPCPPGSYTSFTVKNLAEDAECTECEKKYNQTTRVWQSQYCDQGKMMGPCEAGYVCFKGVGPSPRPGLNISDNEQFGVIGIQYGGLCPSGHYCPEGTIEPVPCEPGTGRFQPGASKREDCIKCPAGSYCAKHMTIPELCPPGTYCPQPSQRPTKCPKGTYNDRSNGTDISFCLPCPAGYFCPMDGHPTYINYPCPVGHYCTSPLPSSVCGMPDNPDPFACGTIEPEPCPVGTLANFTGAANVTGCDPCPAGFFCDASRTLNAVYESCPNGTYCPPDTIVYVRKDRELTVTLVDDRIIDPSTQYALQLVYKQPTPSKETPRPLEEMEGGEGESTAKGVLEVPFPPEVHPNTIDSVVLTLIGGKQQEFTAKKFSVSVSLLTITLYDDIIESGQRYSSRLVFNQGVRRPPETEDILGPPSQPTETGILRVTLTCPDVPPRPKYCPDASTVQGIALTPNDGTEEFTVMGAEPITCAGGTFCPVNSGAEQPCPPGYYCPPESPFPLDCPQGYFCEGMSSGYAAYPEPCPVGKRAVLGIYNRSSEDVACEDCPPGYYTNETASLNCTPCEPGYVCEGGTSIIVKEVEALSIRSIGDPPEVETTINNGYICPVGFYCPTGSAWPFPCIPGTYNDQEGRRNVTDCRKCTAGNFNHRSGQTGCLPCGLTSTSTEGATTCDCVGANRAYQILDGRCVCRPGYRFYDEELNDASTVDSPIECQPIVLPRCDGPRTSGIYQMDTTARDSITGECEDLGNCPNCPEGRGRLLVETGVCDCDLKENPDIVCDEQCRNEMSELYIRGEELVFVNRTTGEQLAVPLITLFTGGVLSGKLVCDLLGDDIVTLTDTINCTVSFQAISGAGIQGLFGSPTGLLEDLLEDYCRRTDCTNDGANGTTGNVTRRLASSGIEMLGHYRRYDEFGYAYQRSVQAVSAAGTDRRMLKDILMEDEHDHYLMDEEHQERRLQTQNATRVAYFPNLASSLSGDPSILDPTQCLELGSTMIWSIIERVYPVYISNSLLNSNPNFDVAPFLKLQEEMELSSEVPDLKLFAYTFQQPGVFVFGASSNTAHQTVIAVLPRGQSCAADVPQPQSIESLVNFRILQSEEVAVLPNVIFIGCLMGGLIGLVLVLMCLSTYLKKLVFKERLKAGLAGQDWSFGVKKNAIDKTKVAVEDIVKGYAEKDEELKAAYEAYKMRVTAMGPDDLQPYLKDYQLSVIDPRLFQAAYEKLVMHHQDARKRFGDQEQLIEDESNAILDEAAALRNALMERIAEALAKMEGIGVTLGKEEGLLTELSSRIDPIYSPDILREAEPEKAEESFLEQIGGGEVVDHLEMLEQSLQMETNQVDQLNKIETALATTQDERERRRLLEVYNDLIARMQDDLSNQKEKKINEMKEQVAQRQQHLKEAREERSDKEDKREEQETRQTDEMNRLKDRHLQEAREEAQQNLEEAVAIANDQLAEGDRKRAELAKTYQQRLDEAGDDQAAKEVIMAEYAEQSQLLEQQLEEERLRQFEQLQAKMAQRAAERRSKQKEEEDRTRSGHQAAKVNADGTLIDAKINEARAQHENEVAALVDATTLQNRKQAETLKQLYKDRVEMRKEQMKNQLQKALDNVKGNTPEAQAERKRLQAEFEQQMHGMEDMLNRERDAQLEQLERKMKERLEKRKAAMQKRQEGDVAYLEKEKQIAAAESEVLNRHERDRAELESEHRAKIEDLNRDKNLQLNEAIVSDQAAMNSDIKRLELQLQDTTDPAERAALQETIDQLKTEIEQHRAQAAREIDESLREELALLDEEYLKQLAAMQERQAGEVALMAAQKVEAVAAARQLADEDKAAELVVRQGVDEEALGEQLQWEDKRQNEELALQLDAVRNETLMEEDAKVKEQLQELEATITDPVLQEQERQQILAEHEQNIARLNDLLDQERLKQEGDMMARIAKQREQRMAALKSKQAAEQDALKAQQEQERVAADLQRQQEAEKRALQEDIRNEAFQQQVQEEQLQAQKLREAAEDIHGRIQRSMGRHVASGMFRDEEGYGRDELETKEAERERIITQWRSQMARQADNIEEERMKQQVQLKQKLEQRRQRLTAEQAAKQQRLKSEQAVERQEVREKLDAQKREEQAISNEVFARGRVGEGGGAVSELTARLQNAAAMVMMKQAEDKFKEEMQELKEKHKQETKETDSGTMKEVERAQKELDEVKAKAAQEVEKQRVKLEVELKVKTANATTDAEKSQLLEEHNRKMAEIEETVSKERSRQEEQLQEKLAARRAAAREKQAKLKAQQDKEFSEKKLQLEREKQELQSDMQREAEEDLKNALVTKTGNLDEIVAKLKAAMGERHQREMQGRVALQYKERTEKLRFFIDEQQRQKEAKMIEFNQEYERRKEVLVQQREQERQEKMQRALERAKPKSSDALGEGLEDDESDEESEEELELKKRSVADEIRELEQERQQKEKEFRDMIQQDFDKAVEEEGEEIGKEQEEDVWNLRDRQLNELITGLQDFATRGNLQAKKWIIESNEERKSLDAKREKRRQEQRAKLAAIELEMRKKEEDARRQIEQQMKELQERMDKERDRAALQADQRLKEQRAKAIQERQQAQERYLQSVKEMDGDLRRRILEQHRSEVKALERALDIERQRQLKKTKERLDAKRRQKEAALYGDQLRQFQQGAEELRRKQQELLERQQKEREKEMEMGQRIKERRSSIKAGKEWLQKARRSSEERKRRASLAMEEDTSPLSSAGAARKVTMGLEEDSEGESSASGSELSPTARMAAGMRRKSVEVMRQLRGKQIATKIRQLRILLEQLFALEERHRRMSRQQTAGGAPVSITSVKRSSATGGQQLSAGFASAVLSSSQEGRGSVLKPPSSPRGAVQSSEYGGSAAGAGARAAAARGSLDMPRDLSSVTKTMGQVSNLIHMIGRAGRTGGNRRASMMPPA